MQNPERRFHAGDRAPLHQLAARELIPRDGLRQERRAGAGHRGVADHEERRKPQPWNGLHDELPFVERPVGGLEARKHDGGNRHASALGARTRLRHRHGRRGHDHEPVFGEASAHETAVWARIDADSHVELLFDKVHHAVFRHQLDRDFRIGRAEFGANPSHREVREQRRRRDAQASARRGESFARRRHGLGHLVHRPFGAGDQRLAGFREFQAARAALDEPHT
jgi:hypothetical protein